MMLGFLLEIIIEKERNVSEDQALRYKFKYDLINKIIDCLLNLSQNEYKEFNPKELIEEFYVSLKEILKEKEFCTKSLRTMFKNELTIMEDQNGMEKS